MPDADAPDAGTVQDTDAPDTGPRAADPDGSIDDVLLLDEADGPLVLAVWEPTGEPRVDAALDRLAELDPDDVHQHAAVFHDVHRTLRTTLTDLEPTA